MGSGTKPKAPTTARSSLTRHRREKHAACHFGCGPEKKSQQGEFPGEYQGFFRAHREWPAAFGIHRDGGQPDPGPGETVREIMKYRWFSRYFSWFHQLGDAPPKW